LLVASFARPSLYERRPSWGSGQESHTRIIFAALDQRVSEELVEALLQRVPDMRATLTQLITDSAEGNPCYMEELVKMLIDDGAIVTTPEDWRVIPERPLAMQVPPTPACCKRASTPSRQKRN